MFLMSNPTLLVINFQWSQLIEMKSFIKSTSTMTYHDYLHLNLSRKSPTSSNQVTTLFHFVNPTCNNNTLEKLMSSKASVRSTGGRTIHLKSAPKRDLCLWNSPKPKKHGRHIKDGVHWENDLYAFFSVKRMFLRSSLLWADYPWIRSSLYLNPWW